MCHPDPGLCMLKPVSLASEVGNADAIQSHVYLARSQVHLVTGMAVLNQHAAMACDEINLGDLLPVVSYS